MRDNTFYTMETDNHSETLRIGGHGGVVKVETWQHGERISVEHYTKAKARELGNYLINAAADSAMED